MDYANLLHGQGQWVLTWELRSILYRNLFVPLGGSVQERQHEYFATISKAEISLLKQIQGFLLRATSLLASSIGTFSAKPLPSSMTYPSLDVFVVDAVQLLKILATPSDLDEPHVARHPFELLSQFRYGSWILRYRTNHGGFIAYDILLQEWKDYICALCDSFFGLWPSEVETTGGYHCCKGSPPFRVASPPVAVDKDCIRSFLTFYHPNFSGSSDKLSDLVDSETFDAACIESCGPFRFKATGILSRHLTISHDNEILYYIDWTKWLSLRNNRVVREANVYGRAGRWVKFDTLTNFYQPAPHHIRYARALSSMGLDILIMNLFCFHKETILSSQRNAVPNRFSRFMRAIGGWLGIPSNSSAKIGRRVGLNLSESEVLSCVAGFIDVKSDDPGLMLDWCCAFKEREVKLYKTLKEWKPKSVWEMRYSGYGGVDPVGLYAFYFASVFGLIAILGLVVSILQAYAGFKTIPHLSQ